MMKIMTVLLGYTTALDHWRSCASVSNRLLHKSFVGASDERKRATSCARSELIQKHCRQTSLKYLRSHPGSHVIVVGTRIKTGSHAGFAHSFSALPSCSCMQSNLHFEGDRILVSTPEFCFLQMAAHLPLEQLIALGYELCGTYAKFGDRTFYGAHQLTSPRKLDSFLSRVRGINGLEKAKRALRYVLPNSASPMETILSMLLTLPYSLGGYGIQAPQLNRRIDIPASFRRATSHPFFVCDLYWEDAKLAIEYDSDFAHAGINKTVQDAIRRSILTGLGFLVLSVTNPQIKNERALNQIAYLVAKQTGKRLRYEKNTFLRNQRKLRSLLLAKGC